MAKRRRTTEHSRERHHRNKRRRYSILSPSTGRPNENDLDAKIRIMEINIDLLRAQLKLLRKEVHDLRHPPPTGRKHTKTNCIVM